MSNSETIRLTISSRNPFHEIWVQDGRNKTLAEGLGYLELDLPPGLYAVSFRMDGDYKREIVSLKPGSGSLRVNAPEVVLETQLPIQQTTAEFFDIRINQTKELSSRPPVEIGKGAGFFLFANGSKEPGQVQPGEPIEVLKGIYLRKPTGEIVFDFSQLPEGAFIDEFVQFNAGINLILDPGHYILSLDREASQLNQIIYLAENWMTRVFLQQDPDGKSFDFAENTIFIDHLGEAYYPERQDLMPTNNALEALRNHDFRVPGTDLSFMLGGKFRNPILGIFWMHLAMRDQRRKPDLFQTVLRNSQDMVPNHPDVLAAFLWFEQQFPDYARDLRGAFPDRIQFELPPMLLSGWRSVVDRSQQEPEIIPIGSLSENLADKLWGTGPWLIWETRNPAPKKYKSTRSISTKANLSHMVQSYQSAVKGLNLADEGDEIQVSQQMVTDAVTDFLESSITLSPGIAYSKGLEESSGDTTIAQMVNLLADPEIFQKSDEWFEYTSPAGQKVIRQITSGVVAEMGEILRDMLSEARSAAMQAISDLLDMDMRDSFSLLIPVWTGQNDQQFTDWLKKAGFESSQIKGIHRNLNERIDKMLTIREISQSVNMPPNTVIDGLLDAVQEVDHARRDGLL